MSQTPNNLASYIWSLADLLRGDFKQSQYGRIILPFTLLRRLECVLDPSKLAVLDQFSEIQAKDRGDYLNNRALSKAAGGLAFYNTSRLDLTNLGQADLKDNLNSYIQAFSSDAREIFEHFNFTDFIGQLSDANLLYEIVKKVRTYNLSPEAISNHDMGLVFEELIRRFAEGSNETAGEHFTPRDIVRLTTSLVFMEDDEALAGDGVVRTIYDPTAGTGGFLSSGMEYVRELNPRTVMSAFGQELNPESYAICKADMLIKGQAVDRIRLGNTLSGDQLHDQHFDYMLSNPPFGVDWKKVEGVIKDEHTFKGYGGRFGPGLPRVSDGSLLFLLHLISKMHDRNAEGGDGARIGIILNGSPLFTGGAGSGESEIRRYILEADLLETIVALPNDMFYNTGIATYVWILSNKKSAERRDQVLLINAVNLYGKMRKSLGSKRRIMGEDDIALITRTAGLFDEVVSRPLDKPAEVKSNRGRQSANPKSEEAKTFAAKIFPTHAFGYRRITVERPLRQSYQFSDERIAELRFCPKPLAAPMKWMYSEYIQPNSPAGEVHYGALAELEAAIRKHLKANFSLKEAKIKDVLNPELWQAQEKLLAKAEQLQRFIGSEQHDDMNLFDGQLKASGVKLETAQKKQMVQAVCWKNPEAEKVIKKVHKGKAIQPLYGYFQAGQRVLEYQSDSELRDYENVALDPSQTVNELNEAYFFKEVRPHVPDAWIDASKTDAQDGEIGIVGYEIPFNRHFYEYKPPRPLEEIDRDLDQVSAEIMKLLREVHS